MVVMTTVGCAALLCCGMDGAGTAYVVVMLLRRLAHVAVARMSADAM